jgi:hypothetical protein
MGWSDVPKMVDDNSSSKPKHVEMAQASTESMFEDVFGLNKDKPKTPTGHNLSNLGRIEHMNMPVGWVAGNDVSNATSYAKEFHPREQKDGESAVDKNDVQMVFSYRGNRLSDDASKLFRALIDSAPEDGKAKTLNPRDLQQAPLDEVLGDRGHKNTFQVISAKVQRINGEPALVVEGKYSNYEVNAKLVYVDAERNSRTNAGAPVQEIAFMAPTKEYYKYSMQANKALDTVRWQH